MHEKTICHQFPLRDDYLAQVLIPANLTKAEADRLCAFVMSLATPTPPSSSAMQEPTA